MGSGSRAALILLVLRAAVWAEGAAVSPPEAVTAWPVGVRSAEELFRLMAEREANVRYQAIRRSLGGRWRPGEVVHLYRDANERFRLEVLDEVGQPTRVMVRSGGRLWVWSAREPEVWRERRAGQQPRKPWANLELLLHNYRAEWVGQEEFLGRPAGALRIATERLQRPELRLWIDLENFLNVKLERTSPSGERTLGFEFTELSFPQRFDESLFAVPEGESGTPPEGRRRRRPGFERFDSLDALARAVEMPLVVPAIVPAGFVETDYSLLSRLGAVRIGYSDGLSAISLYEGGSSPGSRPGLRGGAGREAGDHGSAARSPRSSQVPLDSSGSGPGEHGHVSPQERSGAGEPRRSRRAWRASWEVVSWEGVSMQVARMRGMVFVRRTLSLGEPSVQLRTTVVGEVGEDELKGMSASLVECQVPAAESEASGQRQPE